MSIIGIPAAKKTRWNFQSIRRAIRAGFSYDTVENIKDILRLDNSQLAQILDVSQKTLSRKKHTGRLAPGQADRLYRAARIVALAKETFGNIDDAVLWLSEANRALGGLKPVELLDSDNGVREVEDLLGRIRHGIYS
jgi:putative toxin-antitoxin system antitoxin component (TIGR02293 family)